MALLEIQLQILRQSKLNAEEKWGQGQLILWWNNNNIKARNTEWKPNNTYRHSASGWLPQPFEIFTKFQCYTEHMHLENGFSALQLSVDHNAYVWIVGPITIDQSHNNELSTTHTNLASCWIFQSSMKHCQVHNVHGFLGKYGRKFVMNLKMTPLYPVLCWLHISEEQLKSTTALVKKI